MSTREVGTRMAVRKRQPGGTSTMQLVIGRIHRGLTGIILLGLLAEVYLIGTKLFGATSYQPHQTLGLLLAIAILLLPVLSLAAHRGRRVVGMSGLLVALTAVQVALPPIAASFPWVAALHAINTMAMMGVTMSIARAPLAQPTATELGDSEASLETAA